MQCLLVHIGEWRWLLRWGKFRHGYRPRCLRKQRPNGSQCGVVVVPVDPSPYRQRAPCIYYTAHGHLVSVITKTVRALSLDQASDLSTFVPCMFEVQEGKLTFGPSAAVSRGGLTESCTCHCGGPPSRPGTPPGLDPPPSPTLMRPDHVTQRKLLVVRQATNLTKPMLLPREFTKLFARIATCVWK